MKYLLDTHVLIWSILNTKKLSPTIKSLLQDEPMLFVSAVALWEISIKYRIGKLELEGATPEDLFAAMKKLGFKFISMSETDAASFHNLETLHKDAFDRMMIWQAIKHDMVLVSKDARMEGYKKLGLKLIW